MGEQLRLLLLSAAMGAVGAMVYDVLRAVRLRRPRAWLTHLLDGAYVVCALAAVWTFALRLGEGELRLYMLLGTACGAALYCLVPGAWLRPLWTFWTDAAAALGRLLWQPAAFLLGTGKKVGERVKKDFHFFQKCAKIKKYPWAFGHARRRGQDRGGRGRREKEEKEGRKT